jgi:hypothetical protein
VDAAEYKHVDLPRIFFHLLSSMNSVIFG